MSESTPFQDLKACFDAFGACLGIASDFVTKNIWQIIFSSITWGLITFDTITNWLTWDKYSNISENGGEKVRSYTSGFLIIAVFGLVFWLLESILIICTLRKLYKSLMHDRQNDASRNQHKNKNNDDMSIMKEIPTMDKARVTLFCFIALLEDTPSLVINIQILMEDGCLMDQERHEFLAARSKLMTTANQISVLAATITSFWLIFSSYIVMCKCCCNSDKYCRLTCYGQCCPCCIAVIEDDTATLCERCNHSWPGCCFPDDNDDDDDDQKNAKCLASLLVCPFALICCFLFCIFSYFTNEITQSMKKELRNRYICYIVIFVTYMINVFLGIVFFANTLYPVRNINCNDYNTRAPNGFYGS